MINKNITDAKPLVTFALFTYNQEEFIAEAVAGALVQTYKSLEIIISDDCSNDNTFEIIQALVKDYTGPHQVILNRNPVNLGFGANVNHVLEISHGELVVFAAGDDVSYPQRVQIIVEAWIKAGKPSGSLHSAVEIIFNDSQISGLTSHGSSTFANQSIVECIRTGAKGVLGATHAISSDLFNRFGPLPVGTLFEDRSLVFRSLLAGKVIYCPEVLVKYRRHSDNLTGCEMYTDGRRWSRWIDGNITKYESFLADYQSFMAGKTTDPLVLKEIKQGVKRTERSRNLVNGSSINRMIAAFYYSSDFKMSERLAFILIRGGLKDTVLYRLLSSIWGLYHRFVSKGNQSL